MTRTPRTASERAESVKENFFADEWCSMERNIEDAMDEIIGEVEILETEINDLEEDLKDAQDTIEEYESAELRRTAKLPDRLQAIYITLARTINYLQDAMKESNIEIPDTIDNLGSRIGGDLSHQDGDDQGATEDQTGGVVRPQVP